MICAAAASGLSFSAEKEVELTLPDVPATHRLLHGHDELSLGQEIGHGRTGAVRLGIDKSGERVAVKTLRKSALTPPNWSRSGESCTHSQSSGTRLSFG